MNKNEEEDIISKIYYNQLDGIEELPDTTEYMQITGKIKCLEKELLKNSNSNEIKEYIECINERTSMEVENQFKVGFKTGIKIIIEALK